MSNSPNPRELFESALIIEPSLRADWLSMHCADPDQRTAVGRMLAADAAEGANAIDQSFNDLLARVGDPGVAVPPVGTRIGPFLLHDKLGEGGSSIVFRATREQAGVSQQVALKLLRRNLYTHDEQRRFRDERRALTQLQHPGIARLIEGGITESGTPYIALELIEGESIVEHARNRQLDLRHRLRLFIDVCHAVEAAHRALIVHRDLKPSNVLVTADGEVKLLDFGIAKILDTNLDADGTQTQHVLMTPAYAAPEQFAHGQITTATDVYALGVMLGELITGQRHEQGDSRTPSAQVTDDGAVEAQLASARAMRRKLRGDLDNIVLKATATEPERRYASAGAFADDVARHLAGQPVIAHPPSRVYRARKFVARHRGAVATTMAFLLAIFAALGVAVWQGNVARHSLKRANAMRDFMFSAFAQAEPSVPREGPPRINEVVSQAIATARADTQMNREVRTELLSQLGAVLGGQGQLVPARETLQWNFDQARRDFGDQALLTLDAGRELGASMILSGDFKEARALIDDLLKQVAGRDALLEMKVRLDSANLATKQHERRRALEDAAIAMQLARRIGSTTALEMALDDYGNVQLSSGEIAGAITTYNELLVQREHRFGSMHIDVASAHGELSRAYRRSGDIAAAETHIRQALAIDAAVLPKDHWRKANHLNALMFVLIKQRDYRGALDAATEGLRINRLVNGDDNPEVANDLNSVGMLRGFLGDYQGALEPLRQGLQITIAKWGPKHFESALAHANYGAALAKAGSVAAGEAEITQAITIHEADAEPDFDMQATAWEKLARLRLDRREPASAFAAITHIDTLVAKLAEPGAHWDGRADTLRATALLQQGETQQAQEMLQAAHETLQKSANADAELSVEVALLRARAAQGGDPTVAATLTKEARAALAVLRNPAERLVEINAALTGSTVAPGD
ncbi:MAG: protein kinase [Dokdonella sp.]